MSLTTTIYNKKTKNYRTTIYSRYVNLQQRNPLMNERTNQKCPLCKNRKNYLSLISLYKHLLKVHRFTQRIFESKEDFKIRQEKEFDYKNYILTLAKKLFNGELK